MVETVLLMGQSSMVGLDTTPPSIPTDQRVWVWIGHLGAPWWSQANEPLHGHGYGPGTDFGKHLVAIRPEVGSVMLIPCAVNGAETERWIPGGDLYARCLALAHASGLKPTGALVYQGGSDGASIAKADAWPGRFTSMVNGLRDEYGADFLVVYGQLGHAPGPPYIEAYPHWSQVREVQASLELPGVAMVVTEDLWRMPDGMHWTWFTALTVGQRMARAYAELRRAGL